LTRLRLTRFSSARRASSWALVTPRTCLRNRSKLERSALGCGLRLANGILPNDLAVGDPLADDPGSGRDEPSRIGLLAAIEEGRGLGQVPIQVLRINRVVGPVDQSLEQGPEVIQPVRVDSILVVPLGVIDNTVDVLRLQSEVTLVGIGVERSLCATLRLISP